MKRISFLVFLVAVCCVVAVAQSQVNQEHAKQDAETAAQNWLGLIDKGAYATSWDNAAVLFKAAVNKDDWQKKIAAGREPLGKVLSRKLKSSTYSATLPGAPDGQYVVIQYDTSFENKKAAVETITPMLDKDGQWRVSGYFIR